MSYRNLYIIVILSIISALLAEPQIIIIKKVIKPQRQDHSPPFRNNNKNEQKKEAPDFIRDQFNRDRQYHDRDQAYRPPQEEEKNYTNYYLFGVSMFVLGVLAVLSLYLCVFLYNKWLRKKENVFYNNLHIMKPLDTPITKEMQKIEVKNEGIVPNASQDIAIEHKMYTNNNIVGATEEV